MAKLFRKTGLPRTDLVKDPDTRLWAKKLTKTLDDLTTEQGRQLQEIINEEVTNITNEYTEVIGSLLEGINGTIWQYWDGEVERLDPEEYGMVLTCGGGSQKNFWAWVYEEPGADFGGRIWFTVWLEAEVTDASIIAMDKTKTIEVEHSGAWRENYTDQSRFTNSTLYSDSYHPELTMTLQDASIITMDVTKSISVTKTATRYPFGRYGEEAYGTGYYGQQNK